MANHPVLCVGDPVVDLVCEHPAASLAEASSFVPHLGGATTNVAVTAARAGAEIELLGAVGADPWGAWVRGRLARERVGLERLASREGGTTLAAFTLVDATGEPSWVLIGDQHSGVGDLDASELGAAVDGIAALFVSSNTLIGEGEREATMHLIGVARERELPLIVEANLRLHRWRSRADAAASTNACVPGALLVRASAAEAAILTGEDDPERAASALLKAGARAVVLSLGSDGAILRGELRADAPASVVAAVGGEVRSTAGAGDVLTGVLLARLARSRFYLPSAAAGLRDAVTAATVACARWGALD